MESIILLCLELESRGYTVDIRPCNGLGKKRIVPADVLVVPYCRTCDDLKHWGRFAKGSNTIINIQWEQVYTYDADAERPCKYDPVDNAKFAIHLCWSDSSRTRLIEGDILPENAIVTGPIHLDFYNLKNKKDFFKSKEEIGKLFSINPDKKWILFCSNFSGIISEKEIRQRSNNNDAFASRYQVEKSTKQAVLEWIQKFITDNPEYVFIYRPHPFEKSDLLLDQIKMSYSNFYVIDALSIRQWINAANYSLFWTSTSSVDAFFSKARHGILRPYHVSLSNDMVIFNGASFISTYKEFSDYLLSDNCKKYELQDSTVYKYYDVDTHKPSFMRIADYLENTLNEKITTHTDAFNLSKKCSFKEKLSHTYIFDIYEILLAALSKTKFKSIYSKSGFLKQKIDDAYMRRRDFISDSQIKKEKERILKVLKAND